jgi:hypothetical protein
MALQGTGTELDPYLITNLAELRTEVTNAAAYYKVTQDLDVIDTEWEKEWTECTIACLQLDFNNKKLRNITTALEHDVFKYNCINSEIINANFENITCNKHVFGHVTSYTTMSNLTILNSSFSIKWNGSTFGCGLLGVINTTVDSCDFKLKIFGTIEAIFWSNKYFNRCHINTNGDFTLSATKLETFSGKFSFYTHFLRLLNHGTKIYVTGNAIVNLPPNIRFYFFANERNTAYSAYGDAAYYTQCYIGIKCNFKLTSGTTFGSLNFACPPVFGYWPPANFVVGEWLKKNDVVVTWYSNEQKRTYGVTELQAKSVDYLQSLGFDVAVKE